jgi:hypothetical protein
MALMRAEAFFVRRAGVVVAEPTGGVRRWVPSPDPQRWWASVGADLEAEPADHSHLVEIEMASTHPDHGSIGRVVRNLGRVAEQVARERRYPSDADAVFGCLDRVPESWLPYEVRVGERPGPSWDAFVGTLLPVPQQELRDVLGQDWEGLIRVEPWLTPR